ncbi:MAG: hypothetical protein V4772_07685 [Pseudomonadota bacterium]
MPSSTTMSAHGPGDEDALDDEGLNELPVNPDEGAALVPDDDGVVQAPA